MKLWDEYYCNKEMLRGWGEELKLFEVCGYPTGVRIWSICRMRKALDKDDEV